MPHLNPNLYSAVFAVPTDITDKYLKLASPAALKTLLWILRNQALPADPLEIAKCTGYTAADIADAIEYWVEEGVLLADGAALAEKPSPKPQAQPPKSEAAPAPTPQRAVPEVKISRPTLEQLNARMAENEEITFLMREAQSILGRTFGFDMQSTLLMFYDTYGLKLEIILTLLQFCVQQGTAATSYIARLGKTWAEKEIHTLEEANTFIENSLNANQVFVQLKALTGISTPRPTAVQTNYITAWTHLGFSPEMMALAFDETADRTGKISFNYMNKILLNWSEKGYRTPEDVENGKKQFSEQKSAASVEKRSYDIDSAFDRSSYRPPQYKKKERAQK